jgi:hypothetical protein
VEVTEGGCDNCYAGCTGEYEPLRCEGGELQVEASAECEAACEAELSVEASCTPPMVFVVIDGDVEALADLVDRYVAALEVGLPALLAIAERAILVLDAAAAVVEASGGVADAVVTLGTQAVACAGLTVIASAEIHAKVDVSVSASVEVSGAAGATTSGG